MEQLLVFFRGPRLEAEKLVKDSSLLWVHGPGTLLTETGTILL